MGEEAAFQHLQLRVAKYPEKLNCTPLADSLETYGKVKKSQEDADGWKTRKWITVSPKLISPDYSSVIGTKLSLDLIFVSSSVPW